jgi:TPR repeat protein
MGAGVLQDRVESYKWFDLAAAQGLEESRQAEDVVAKEMTPQQIAEAQKLSAEWKPKK